MQFIKEFEVDVSSIQSFLVDCSLPFSTSELYSPQTASKFVDESQRLSKFRSIRSTELFAICRELLEGLSQGDPLNEFTLVENEYAT